MTILTGKNATVTFDVITSDQEAKQLLDQVITNTVEKLLQQDKDRLKQAVSGSQPPKPKPASAPPEVKYAKERIEEPELLPLGGKWTYSVGIVQDQSGEKAVRIAKGTIKGSFYRDKILDQMVLKPNDKMHPIAEVNKINIKTTKEWGELQGPVLARLKAIEEGQA